MVVSLIASPLTYAMSAQLQDGNNSQWVSNSPHVEVMPGQQFVLHFTFKNDGTTTWSDAGGYALACDTYYHTSGLADDVGYTNDCLQSSPVGFNGAIVPPGGTFTFDVTLTATSQYSGNQFNTWWDLKQNGQIFGNNNNYVQVDFVAGFSIGQVWIVGSQSQLLDDMGNPLPDHTCPGGKIVVPAVVQSNWDVVELASTSVYRVPGYHAGIEGPRDGVILVAAPDPCNQQLDFSDNNAINDGTGFVGYIEAFGLQKAMTASPSASQSLWRNCWPASQCSDAYMPSGFNHSLSAYNENPNITVWTNGSVVDPHWWEVQDSSGNPAAVYGRDWSAQACTNPDPVQGCSPPVTTLT